MDILWTMILFFCWVAWIWVLVVIIGDLFRRHDTSGWVKALWVIVLIFLPFLGVLIYMIVNGKGMSERQLKQAQAGQEQFAEYVQLGHRPRAERRARDREGQGAARQRRDHAGGVRLAEGQGARLSRRWET